MNWVRGLRITIKNYVKSLGVYRSHSIIISLYATSEPFWNQPLVAKRYCFDNSFAKTQKGANSHALVRLYSHREFLKSRNFQLVHTLKL